MEETIIDKNIINSGILGDVQNKGQYAASRDIIINHEDTASKISCPVCGAEPNEEEKSDKIHCNNCLSTYYPWHPTNKVSNHKNLPPEQNNAYADIIFLIDALIEYKNFDKADSFCNDAIDLASRVPQAWEYKALLSFFKNSKNKTIANEAKEILYFLKIAKLADYESITYNKIAQTISYSLFYSTVFRYNQGINEESQYRGLREALINQINTWIACYEIYPDQRFLKQALSELSKPDKWILKLQTGELRSIFLSRGFNPVNTWNKIIRNIRSKSDIPQLYHENELNKKNFIFSLVMAIKSRREEVEIAEELTLQRLIEQEEEAIIRAEERKQMMIKLLVGAIILVLFIIFLSS